MWLVLNGNSNMIKIHVWASKRTQSWVSIVDLTWRWTSNVDKTNANKTFLLSKIFVDCIFNNKWCIIRCQSHCIQFMAWDRYCNCMKGKNDRHSFQKVDEPPNIDVFCLWKSKVSRQSLWRLNRSNSGEIKRNKALLIRIPCSLLNLSVTRSKCRKRQHCANVQQISSRLKKVEI